MSQRRSPWAPGRFSSAGRAARARALSHGGGARAHVPRVRLPSGGRQDSRRPGPLTELNVGLKASSSLPITIETAVAHMPEEVTPFAPAADDTSSSAEISARG